MFVMHGQVFIGQSLCVLYVGSVGGAIQHTLHSGSQLSLHLQLSHYNILNYIL